MTTIIDSNLKSKNKGKEVAHRRKAVRHSTSVEEHQGQLFRPQVVNIDTLPDEVLLEIFNAYLNTEPEPSRHRETIWHTLTLVCQRWRCIVFESPNRLTLEIFITPKRSSKLFDAWRSLPIWIEFVSEGKRPRGMATIVAALKLPDRVYGIDIQNVPNSLVKKFAAMKKPFPNLEVLGLRSNDTCAPMLPASFLGGSAPNVGVFVLHGIPFPALSKLLLSTRDLGDLRLSAIPPSGYISPQSMIAILSMLTRLKYLSLGFRSPRSRADREKRPPPPLRRSVLPALVKFNFRGDSKYLEDIVSRIDAPLLDCLSITFFNQLVFGAPQLCHLLRRTEAFEALDLAEVSFYDDAVVFTSSRAIRFKPGYDINLDLCVSCKPSDWQLSSIAQLYSSAFSPLPPFESLAIIIDREDWQDDIETAQWLEFLRPLTSVGELHLHEKSVQALIPTLGELSAGNVTEVLPALQNLFIEGPKLSETVKAIGRFTSARQLSGFPVSIHHTDSQD